MRSAVEKENKKKKKYRVNVKKFVIAIFIILVIITILICVCSKKKISDSTNVSKLNSSKYSKQILQEYEKDGMLDKFIEDYENIQTSIGMYILNNSTMDSDSFTNISNSLNKELKSDTWKSIELNRPTTWNGEWKIDDEGKLKFKFDTKEIEPSWVKNENVTEKILLN